jgi:hypothetical protein
MAGYIRQSVADIINGAEITAPPLNAEFNQLVAAFNASSGHTHTGATGDAPKISLTTSVSGILPAANGGTGGANKMDATTAPATANDNTQGYAPGSLWEDVSDGRVYICVGNATGAAVWRELVTIFTNNKIEPAAHNTVDLGTPTVRFQDLFLQGGIAAAGNTALGGTLNVTGASTLAGTANITGAATMASTLGVSGNVVLSTNLNVSGTTTLSTVDINAGSIDNAAIGVTTASTGAFTTITTSGQATLASADINGGSVDGAVIGAGTPAAITGTNITANTGFVGDLTGNVAGNLTGNSAGTHTGAVVGDVTGNVTASSGLSTFNNVTVNGTLDVTGTTIANVTDPSNAQDAATKNYVDTADALKLNLAGGTLSGDLAMASNKVTGLADPASAQDAATKAYVDAADATKLPLAGGTMSGDVAMGGNTVTGLAAPSASSDATTKTYVDTADALKLNLAGGTMSGDLAMGSNKVTGVGTPTADTDAANKAYVDAEVSAVIDAAPGALDTLNELAAAINDDANFSTTITNSIATKLPLAGGTMSGDIALGANKATSTATPTTDDTLTRKGYVDTQDALKVAKAGDTMTGDLSLGSNKVTSTATPATDDTLTRKGYVDTQDALKLNLAGGTMSGDITLGSNKATSSVDPATADTLARKAYIDNADALKLNLTGGTMSGPIAMGTSKITGVGDPTSNQDASTKAYTDTQRDTRVAKAGDTMSGNLAMGSNKVTGLAAPTATGDATNKSYVDGILGSATSAASSASAASTSATNAASSATGAASSAASAAASYDDFDDRYLGAKSSAPSTDNDGNSLLTGALYWNTSSNSLFVWTGSAWNAGAFDTSNALVATNNLSDLDNAATARTNLGFNAGVDAHLNTSTASNGEYLSWNGSDYDWASVPAGYADSDVDTHLNTGTASNGQYLGWNGSDYAWATVDTSTLMPKAGGTFTGDVTFDGATAGRDIVFDRSRNSLEFADNAEAKFGNNGDLEIRHTGAESIIYNYNGNLTIKQFKNDADVSILTDNGSGGTARYFLADGSTGEAVLYHYGNQKLATKSTGIDVTGNITVSGTVDGRDIATDGTKLDGIESGADVTDTSNVNPLVDAHLNTSSATAGRYLNWDGSDYTWSEVPPSGTLEAVASGSLPDGSPVVINSDGTVSTITLVTPSTGTPVVFENATTNGIAGTFDSSSNKVVIIYEDSGNSGYATAVVGTVSGTSISFGTPVVFNSAFTSQKAATFDSASNKVVIAYKDGGNSSYGTAVIGTVSGTSISFGTPVVFESASTSYIRPTFDSASNKVVIAYADQGNSSHGTAIVGTVSGTSISFGTPVVFESGFSSVESAIFDSTAAKVVIAYGDFFNSSRGTVVVGTVSGTSISFGTPVVFDSTSNSGRDITANFDSSTSKVVITYRNSGNSQYGRAVVGTVSGTSISFGTPVVFYSGTTYEPSSTFDSNSNKIVVVYRDITNGDLATAVVGTVSGNSISFNSPVVFYSGSITSTFTIFDSNANKVVVAYRDMDNSNYGTAAIADASGTTNITASNFLGFSDGAYSDTDTATVTIDGGVNSAQSGLTAGLSYYIADDGSLSTTNSGRKAGVATGSTNILVNKALSGPEMNDYLGSLI